MALLEFTERGIFCPRANVYLDPWKPVDRALITHGHSDHARWGHKHYLCVESCAPIIKYRLRLDAVQTVKYGEVITIGGVDFSFHPAGHIPGSAQIRVAYKDEVWVFTGDYKTEPDNLSEPFELVKCHALITESTFGLPIYNWDPQREIFDEVNKWWKENQAEGKVSVISGYTLGKSQRILKNIDTSIGKVFTHGAVHVMNELLRDNGIMLPDSTRVSPDHTKHDFEGSLVICPPSAVGSPWIRKFAPFSLGIASGWMNLRGTRRRRGADRGFALSDHVDWRSLNEVVMGSGAEKVFVTHGYSEIYARFLTEKGIDARPVKSAYEGELSEIVEASDKTEPEMTAEPTEREA